MNRQSYMRGHIFSNVLMSKTMDIILTENLASPTTKGAFSVHFYFDNDQTTITLNLKSDR